MWPFLILTLVMFRLGLNDFFSTVSSFFLGLSFLASFVAYFVVFLLREIFTGLSFQKGTNLMCIEQ